MRASTFTSTITTAAAVQLPTNRLGLANSETTTAPLAASIVLYLALAVSLTVLSMDYWGLDIANRGGMPLALTIRRNLPIDARIVVLPAPIHLLNLARRRAGRFRKTSHRSNYSTGNSGASHLAGACVGQHLPTDAGTATNSCRRWWMQAPVPGRPAQQDLPDSDRHLQSQR